MYSECTVCTDLNSVLFSLRMSPVRGGHYLEVSGGPLGHHWLLHQPFLPQHQSNVSQIFLIKYFQDFFLWCAYWQVLSVEISVVTELERTKSSNQSTVSILTNFFCNKTQPKPCLLLKSKPVLSEEQRAVHDCWVHKVHHHVHQPLKNSLKYPRQGSHAIITQIQLQTSNFWLWRQQPPTEVCRTQWSYYRMAKFKSAESP